MSLHSNDNIDNLLDGFCLLPEQSKSLLKKHITEVSLPKSHLLFRADRIENRLYLIKKGIARAYCNQGEREVTFWFGQEGSAVLSMKSYVENQPGYEWVELLEESELCYIDISTLQELYEQDINIANWGRKLAEKELVATEERLISREFRTATERYRELLETNPGLLQRVPLGIIASYLGITQVSLSRIRSELR